MYFRKCLMVFTFRDKMNLTLPFSVKESFGFSVPNFVHIRNDDEICEDRLWVFLSPNQFLTSDCRVNIRTTRPRFQTSDCRVNIGTT